MTKCARVGVEPCCLGGRLRVRKLSGRACWRWPRSGRPNGSGTFEFPTTDFDISRYFKLSVGIGVEAAKPGLRDLSTAFRVPLDDGAEASLTLTIEVPPAGDTLVVRTKTVADDSAQGLSFFDGPGIVEAMLRAKNRAKRTFFDFATAETHTIMGARS